MKVSDGRRRTWRRLARADARGATAAPATRPPTIARRPIMQPNSEDAFEQAALAALDGRRSPGRRLAGGLRLAQPLLLLLGIEDDARRRGIAPEDQAVDPAF